MISISNLTYELPKNNKFCSEVIHRKTSLKFYFHGKSSEDTLFVLFPGAYDRDKGITQFQRYSWSDDIPGNVIIFDDPTIAFENDLSIGWFQGSHYNDPQPLLKKTIEKIIQALSIRPQNVFFFGSSAGGFFSLKMMQYFPDSTAIVINPQTNVLKYSWPHLSKLLNYSFECNDISTLSTDINSRLECLPLSNGTGMIFYFQNIFDKVHYNKHLIPFLSNIKEKNDILETSYENSKFDTLKKINILYYEDSARKHSPPSKDISLDFIYIAYNAVINRNI